MDNRLEEILNEKGIKKTWLAEKVGINRNTITNIINGSTPSLALAHKIAKALGLSMYDIWDLV